ncbi:receptor-like protein kinase precursor [Seminavis robusta]|uniref:Receptor-like protein kinase n=1 Tax=Seminavis robusta TaxID=568900 RepID=A0A9N8HM55_9STRA|nr:receptor-like protein kinase precursor [Seminavis robusta]|eukprot:Sro720_g192620.1 receptor-like protein kinase precursor (830) ;mRNA; f:29134-31707
MDELNRNEATRRMQQVPSRNQTTQVHSITVGSESSASSEEEPRPQAVATQPEFLSSSSSSSSDDTDASESLPLQSGGGTMALLEVQDIDGASRDGDSSAESDSGWSDTSGNSDDPFCLKDQGWGIGEEGRHYIQDTEYMNEKVDSDIKTDIIEKIIQTRRRSLTDLHGMDETRVEEKVKETGVGKAITENDLCDFEELPPQDAPLPPPPPPPRSPIQPSPKSVLSFKDFSPKQPKRRYESDDECSVEDSSEEDGDKPVEVLHVGGSMRPLNRPPPPPLIVETKSEEPSLFGAANIRDPDFSFRDEGDGNHSDVGKDMPDLEDALRSNLVTTKATDNTANGQPPRTSMKLGLAFPFCVCLILGIALGLLVGFHMQPATSPGFEHTVSPTSSSDANRPMPTLQPTTMPTGVPYTPVLDVLSAVSSDNGAAIRQFGSPQQQAYLWLLQQINPGEDLKQRNGESRASSRTAPVDIAKINVNLRRIIQRYALATFFFSTGGPSSWRETGQWMNASLDECLWAGDLNIEVGETNTSTSDYHSTIPASFTSLVCDIEDSDGYVWLSSLHFHDNYLSGELPPELGLLSDLRILVIKQGPIASSTDYRQHSNATRKLGSALPSEIGLLTQLESLILNGHDFGLILPSEMHRLRSLHILDLKDNQLMGQSPTFIESMDQLRRLDLGRNLLEGSMPLEWGHLSRLEWLHLEQNRFVGELPTSLGLLSNLTSFHVHGNHLNGSIPDEFEQWAAMQSFQIHGNDFSGSVPEGLCNALERHRQISPWMVTSTADCPLEISCSCCQVCCTDGEGCNVNNDLMNASVYDDIGSFLFRESMGDPNP